MYVGDIGDYGKYGLLRATVPSTSKLGIVWYLIPDESHLNDGRHIDYLSSLKYIICDRQLFSILKDIVSSGQRNISQIELSSIFPSQTAYYSEYLSYNGIAANTPTGRENRLLERKRWLNSALEAISGCDVVFLDPDNGLEIPSVSVYSTKAPKYVLYDEVEKFLSKTNSLIIYHHLCRNGDHTTQIKQRKSILEQLAGESYTVLSLRFQPYSPRVYYIITNQESIKTRVSAFANSNWKQCFELVE